MIMVHVETLGVWYEHDANKHVRDIDCMQASDGLSVRVQVQGNRVLSVASWCGVTTWQDSE
jgi:hypothetical protein